MRAARTKKKIKDMLTLTQACIANHVTRQAYYMAIKKGHLKAEMISNQWFLKQSDIDAYKMNKHDRLRSKFNGEPVYREEHQEISVQQAAKLLGLSPQTVYYFVRLGRIPHVRKGGYIVINFEDAKRVKKGDPRQLSIDLTG